jgi:acyl-CoA thioester hydrolase
MDDLLEVRTLSREVSGASITLVQRVVRGEEVLIEAEVRVAFVSEGKPKRIPEPLRKAMGADAQRNPARRA